MSNWQVLVLRWGGVLLAVIFAATLVFVYLWSTASKVKRQKMRSRSSIGYCLVLGSSPPVWGSGKKPIQL